MALDLGEVERQQAALLELVDELVRTPDADRQAQLVQLISERTDQLTRVCEDLEARARASAKELRGQIEIVLTVGQREQVRSATGIDMESVMVRDDGGGLVAAMQSMSREQVYAFALAEAEKQQREAQARDAARVEFERISGELRRDAPSQVRQEIDRLLEDPEFRKAFAPRAKNQ